MAKKMTPAEKAYAAALRHIAQERKKGATRLTFDSAAYRALDRIPPVLRDFPGLTVLNFDNTAITDLASLQTMTGLQWLSIEQTAITDLAPFQGMTGLEGLCLSQTAITDLTPLQGLIELKALYLSQTAISDLSPLLEMTELQSLSLDQTAITDLAPLRGMTGLQTLYLDQTAITDLAPLQGMIGLQTLSLDQTSITDLTPLHGMTGLRTLYLTQTAITDLAPLQGMTGLQKLYLTQTAITDLTHLQGMTGLQILWFTGSKVRDMRPIIAMSLRGEGPYDGLRFSATPASERDPKLRALSLIEDGEQRTRDTIAYLKTLPPWPEPLPDELPLTLEAVLTAQTPLGWRFSPAHGAMALYVEDQPLKAFQTQLADMAAKRTTDLLQKVGGANSGFRQEVAIEAKRFSEILADETRSLSVRSLELWGSLVALGSHLDANDVGRREGRHSADILSGEQRAALMTLLQIAGNLVRSFPDVKVLDDSAGSFLRREVTIEMVASMIEAALRTAFVTDSSGALMQHVAGVALVDGAQSDKAASVSVRGTLNLITLATKFGRGTGKLLSAAALGAAGFVGKGVAEHYELDQTAIAFIEQVKDQIPEFIASLPPDEAAQLSAAVEEMREQLETPKIGPQ